MKRIYLTFAIFLLGLSGFSQESIDLDEVFDRIVVIESNNNPYAIGDQGRAIGVAQIHEGVIVDVNEFHGENYSHEDAFSPEKSREIFNLYIDRLKKTVGISSEEEIVRSWNGGTYGSLKDKTVEYWHKYLNL